MNTIYRGMRINTVPKLWLTFLFGLCIPACQLLVAQTIQFPYTSSSVNIGDLDVKGNRVTIEAMIYMDKNTLAGNVVGKHVNPLNVNYLLRPLTFELTTYVSGNSGETRFMQLFNPQPFALNKWYHIAGVYDGGSMRYYVNGCLVADTVFSGNLYQNDFIASIGNRSTCECEQFSGQIDEVRIWNTPRSQQEIVQNMLSLPDPPHQPGLQAYYQFNNDYKNNQGDARWTGTPSGTVVFATGNATVDQNFYLSGILTDKVDCEKVKNGSITLYTNRSDALFSLDGVNYQDNNRFNALAAGNYKTYAKTPEGCLIKNDVVVGNSHQLVPVSMSGSLCTQSSFMGHSNPGTYTDTIPSVSGCDTLRTVTVTANLRTVVNFNHTICEGDSYQGHQKAGQYADTLTGVNGCDSINVLNLVVQAPPHPDLGDNRSLCKGDSVSLSPGKYNSYLWQDGSANASFTVTQAGMYSVKVGNACGAETKQILITDGYCGLFFPTAFSPNGDGANDLFRPAVYNLSNFQWMIFNRMGQIIFETKENGKGWDGRINGQPQNTGVYIWICSYTINGKTEVKKGTMVLLR